MSESKLPTDQIDGESKRLTTSTETSATGPVSTALKRFTDQELEALLTDLQRFDEDSFVTVAHSNAVKD